MSSAKDIYSGSASHWQWVEEHSSGSGAAALNVRLSPEFPFVALFSVPLNSKHRCFIFFYFFFSKRNQNTKILKTNNGILTAFITYRKIWRLRFFYLCVLSSFSELSKRSTKHRTQSKKTVGLASRGVGCSVHPISSKLDYEMRWKATGRKCNLEIYCVQMAEACYKRAHLSNTCAQPGALLRQYLIYA